MNEGVGKKIVDALKEQSDIEIQNVVENPAESFDDSLEFENFDEQAEENQEQPMEQFVETPVINQNFVNTMKFTQPAQIMENDSLDDFEIPTNVAVLKQLINQLPAGVSKQTGAQIIKQTMEALGISMKSVLQEAQAVQENLNNSSRECQASIIEHRKQIGLLERQAQKFQRQYNSLNDIISLFVQTSL